MMIHHIDARPPRVTEQCVEGSLMGIFDETVSGVSGVCLVFTLCLPCV